MGKVLDGVIECAAEVGMNILQTEKAQKIGSKALFGVGAIGAGTLMETAGIATAGYSLVGMGCAAAQTAITTASTVPVVGGVLASGIASASSVAFAVASNPVTLTMGVVAAGGYLLYKFIKD